jgi:predicted amidohydrolase YtcJ
MLRTAFVALILLITTSAGVAAETADSAYINGKIYTVDATKPWAEAVAIKDGKFIAVGSNEAIAAVTGEGTKVVDLDGGFAMPGIHDTHVHPPLVYGHEEAGRLLFSETNSPDEIIEIVKEYAAKFETPGNGRDHDRHP